MEVPNTYVGYDKDGKQICSCTATDANTYINPKEVKAGIKNVVSETSDGMIRVRKALQRVAEYSETAIIVQGTKMTKTIEQTSAALGSLPERFGSKLDGMYEQAIEAHDRLQREANREAESKVSNTSGVVSVRS